MFDPFDLTTLEVRYQGRPMGQAVPHRIGRHVHPDARPDLPPPVASPTGIDYLALVAAQHRQLLAARINYTDLPTTGAVEASTDGQDAALEAELASFTALHPQHGKQVQTSELPGQLDLTDLTDHLSDNPEGP